MRLLKVLPQILLYMIIAPFILLLIPIAYVLSIPFILGVLLFEMIVGKDI